MIIVIVALAGLLVGVIFGFMAAACFTASQRADACAQCAARKGAQAGRDS